MHYSHLLVVVVVTAALSVVRSFSTDSFSLSAYQKARALETFQSLDASRLHFQILFVDDDNARGRLAEGLLARIAEHNDAMVVLYPASATIESSRRAPRDAAAPEVAVRAGQELRLCPTIATAIGTSFDLSYLDEYDLIVALDDDIRSLILRSLGAIADQEYYAPKCRLLSEFLSPEFCSTSDSCRIPAEQLLELLEPDLRQRVEPIVDSVMDRSSNVFFGGTADEAAAALILATAGLCRFCLDAIDSQLESAFVTLLQQNFPQPEQVNSIPWEKADAQLCRCSYGVTGYFSPQQRRQRFDRYRNDLQQQSTTSP